MKSADTAAHVYAQLLRLDCADYAGLVHGLPRGGHCVLAVYVHATAVALFHAVIGYVKVLYLGRHAALVFARVEFGYGAYAAFARVKAFAEGCNIIADGGDYAHAGYNYSHIIHLTCKGRRLR